jgi:hypothetical protein
MNELIQVEARKWKKVAKNNMLIEKITERMTSARIEWQKRIHMVDPD